MGYHRVGHSLLTELFAEGNMAASPPSPSMRIHANTNLYGPQHTIAYTETTMGFVFRSWLLIHTLAHVARQTTWPKHAADETPSASLAVIVLDMSSAVWDITFTSGGFFSTAELSRPLTDRATKEIKPTITIYCYSNLLQLMRGEAVLFPVHTAESTIRIRKKNAVQG